MAKVAQAQLAFERYELPPAIMRTDYWTAPNSNPFAMSGTNSEDHRGLKCSARLLADIYQLDQYTFATNKRKLAISKALSLAQIASAAFHRFRETGVFVFNMLMELFFRDFPGHNLRLIRRVRKSAIALTRRRKVFMRHCQTRESHASSSVRRYFRWSRSVATRRRWH